MPQTNGERWAQQFPELRKNQGATKHANLASPTPRKAKPKATALVKPVREDDMLIITLPLPSPQLQPNRKTSLHHMARARITKGAREAAGFVARMVKGPDHPWTNVRLDLNFWTAGRPDRECCIGWVKSYVDALQDAGIIVNDFTLEYGDVVRNTGKQSDGKREVELVITKLP